MSDKSKSTVPDLITQVKEREALIKPKPRAKRAGKKPAAVVTAEKPVSQSVKAVETAKGSRSKKLSQVVKPGEKYMIAEVRIITKPIKKKD
jgi:hypothetical protein